MKKALLLAACGLLVGCGMADDPAPPQSSSTHPDSEPTDGAVILHDGQSVSPPAGECLGASNVDVEATCRQFFADGCDPHGATQIVVDPSSTFAFAPAPRPLVFRSSTCGQPTDLCAVGWGQLEFSEHLELPGGGGGLDSVLGLHVAPKWSQIAVGVPTNLVPSEHAIGYLVESGTDVAGPSGQFTVSPLSLFFQNRVDPTRTNPVTTATMTPLAIVHDAVDGGYAALAFELHFADGTWFRGAVRAPWRNDQTPCPGAP